jgi:hypothetical protein
MARHVVIAIPAYSGTIHLGTMRSLILDVTALMQRDDNISIDDECGNTDIADARSAIVARFLKGNGTDLVFVDHDVMWEEGALLKLVDYPVDFVAGVYPRRAEPIEYSVRYLDQKEIMADVQTGLIEVAGVAAGFMRCSRAMLERMVGDYAGLNYVRQEKTYCGLFDAYRLDDRKLSEDYSFCQRWRDIGGKVWIDPEIKMGHVGSKVFTGHFGQWLKGR